MPSLLLVDDNPGDVFLVRRAVERVRPDVELRVANDVGAARNQIAVRPDLVLLDLNLHGTDGRRFLAELKHNTHTRRIPVVVFSSSDSDSDKAECYGHFANGYVVKPLDNQDLETLIERLLGFWIDANES